MPFASRQGSSNDVLTAFLSVVGTVATLLVGFGVYWLTKRGSRKALTYNYTSVRVDNFDRSFRGEMQITYRGVAIEDVSLVTLNFRNTGTIPIESSDFNSEVTVSVPKRRLLAWREFAGQTSNSDVTPSIIAVQRSCAIPKELLVSATLETPEDGTNAVKGGRLLLNAKDEFSLLLLVRGFNEQLEVEDRIVGVARIENHKPEGNAMPFREQWHLLLLYSEHSCLSSRSIHR